MKVTFNDQELEDLYNVPLNNIGKQQFSKAIIKNYQKRIQILKYANDLGDIARFKGLNLEKLNNKKYKLCYSIRINDQFRSYLRKLEMGK